MITAERFEAAPDFHEYLATVEKNAELWHSIYERVRIADSYVDRVHALGRNWHLLALSEDWCGDAVNALPVVAKLADLAGNLDLRVLGRDANPDIMDAHLTGASRSIPVIILLDAQFNECGWWGPRPLELQTWVLGPGQALDKTERYRETRRWYARDQGRAILDEVVSKFEVCAARAVRAPERVAEGR